MATSVTFWSRRVSEPVYSSASSPLGRTGGKVAVAGAGRQAALDVLEDVDLLAQLDLEHAELLGIARARRSSICSVSSRML